MTTLFKTAYLINICLATVFYYCILVITLAPYGNVSILRQITNSSINDSISWIVKSFFLIKGNLPSHANKSTVNCLFTDAPEIEKEVMAHQKQVNCVTLSIEDKLIVTGSNDGTVKVWDSKNLKCRSTLQGYKSNISSIAISPDSKLIAGGGPTRNEIVVWNTDDLKIVQTLSGHKESIASLAWHPNGKTLSSSAGGEGIWLWNVATGKRVALLETDNADVLCLSYTSDGKYLVSGTSKGEIIVWETNKYQKTYTLKGHSKPVVSLSIPRHAAIIVSSGSDEIVRIWNIKNGTLIRSIDVKGSDKDNEDGPFVTRALTTSPNGEYAMTGYSNGNIKLWSIATGKHINDMNAHTLFIGGLACTNDGKTVISVGHDKMIRAWTLSSYLKPRR